MRHRPFFLAAGGLFLGLAFALSLMTAAAQGSPPVLATWDVQIWPEHDKPTVLVIATGAVVTGTTFPQPMSLPLPPGASIHAVAYPGEAGNLLTLPWTIEAGPAGQSVVFDLNQPRFVVEYYADILSPPPNRSFELDLGIPYAAQQASATLRQPARASALQVTPAMTAAGMDDLGNPTYTLALGSLAAGQSVPFQISYTKADAEPSKLPAAPAPVDVPAPAPAAEGQSWLPLALGLAVGALAGMALLYFVLNRRSTAGSRQARRRDARRKGDRSDAPRSGISKSADSTASQQFCVQCGQKFDLNDRFCRGCGATRR
ncbi:MAG: zinc ribbon domain-containing protein [Anaerolineae bacterium]|jgi:hypothetical protein